MFPRIEEIGMKKPRYIQLSDEIRNMILNNEYQYEEMFPPERELETTYEMDRKTIRKALNILVEEGLLTRIKGKGTFVNSPDINYSMRKISGFGGLLEQQGIESTAKVISVSEEQAGYRLGKLMEIGRAEPVWKMIRQRFAKGEPLALEITYVKQGIIPDFANIDFEVYSLYDMYTKHGHVPAFVEERIDAVEVSAVEAKYLGIQEGESVFSVSDITRDQDQKVIEYTRTYTNSSRIKLSTQLS